ncbi:GNAT family N-acetyltransferase [Methylobacterium aquaticum]|uniref:GNAT family N-acetyltransferase n=1 Tax=Methylobacterium aquaticum TaxID=270351 RepID=UPI001934ABD4|nr:GNAT family N-acetyltransferase [Methylobacterium aquaticum]QRE77418.1 GNAT family N-acetyltransferase [Methylobacterium aquaticum]
MACTIRLGVRDDATEISRVVLSALDESNARDHGQETVARVARSFVPEGIAAQIATRQVFVAPDAQGRGIGRALMGEIERAAEVAGIAVLTLQSSLTAEARLPGEFAAHCNSAIFVYT